MPLSENHVAAERHLGTRHRAAVGLSEQTDAVVLVVSEESGAVSVARAGRLSVHIDDRDRLEKVLGAIVRPPRRTREAQSGLLANLLGRLSRANTPTEKLRT